MNRNRLAVWVCGVMLAATTTFAGSTLSVRLVEASNGGGGMGTGLGDVAHLLQSNLPYRSFQLLGSRSMSLPAESSAALGRGVTVNCSGQQGGVTVTVDIGGRTALQSTVSLRDNTPLVLGGFSSGSKGKLIVILLAK